MTFAYAGAFLGVILLASAFGVVCETRGDRAVPTTSLLALAGLTLVIICATYLGAHGAAT